MYRLLYNSAIYFLNLVLHIGAIFNRKARLIITGRLNWKEKLSQQLGNNGGRIVWFHCASLGEFEQGRPVLEQLKKHDPGIKILLTFFSPSGYEVRKKYPYANFIFYLPADTPGNAKKWIEMVHPELTVFIKYEYWYNYIRACFRNNVPVISVSSIFRPEQIFFQWYGSYFLALIKTYNHFFVQDENSKNLLFQHEVTQVTVSGDTRFDRVREITENPATIPLAEYFGAGRNLIILGSVWPSDMVLLTDLLQADRDAPGIILAPHNVSEKELRKIESFIQVPAIRFSMAREKDIGRFKVLLIDNIGMLSSLYRYGKVAFVGGASRSALHNILEPASYGLPVIIGKDRLNSRFREAVELGEKGGLFEVENSNDVLEVIRNLLSDVPFYQNVSRINRKYILDHTGATGKILKHMEQILSAPR